jgi:hypothetical protein
MSKIIIINNDFKNKRDAVESTFKNWIEKSIALTYRTLKEDTSGTTTPLMAYLLISCAIDSISGFYSGRDPKNTKALSWEYKKFIMDFMPKYDPELLYKDLRCKIAHNFSLGKEIGLTHNSPIQVHLVKDIKGRTTLNFEDFFNDYNQAIESYFFKLDNDIDLQRKFLKRYNKDGIVALTGADFNSKDIK